jgi:cytochrome c oxidase subunit 1
MSAAPEPAAILDRDLTPEALDARLAATWDPPPGLIGWLSTVDHKMVGRRYIATEFYFLQLGGVLALE